MATLEFTQSDGAEWPALLAKLTKMGNEHIEAERLPGFLQQAAKDIVLDGRWMQRKVAESPDNLGRVYGLGQIATVQDITTLRALTYLNDDDVRNGVHGQVQGAAGAPIGYYVDAYETVVAWPPQASKRDLIVTHWSRLPWQIWYQLGLNTRTWTRHVDPAFQTPAYAVNMGINQARHVLGAAFDDVLVLRARILALEDTDESFLRDSYAQRYVARIEELQEEFLDHNADEPDAMQRFQDWA